MIRVAIVDDHPIARYGVRSMLAAAPEVIVVAAVGQANQLPDAHSAQVDVVICDPFPVGEPPALGVVGALSRRARVLVVSAVGGGDAAAALRHGARAVLTKHASAAALVATVRAVAAGRPIPLAVPEPPRPAGSASTIGAAAISATHAVLSHREQQALAFIARGFTHQQTATRMGVSKATVDTYVARIRSKLRVGNKAELALAALHHVGSPDTDVIEMRQPRSRKPGPPTTIVPVDRRPPGRPVPL